jgi:hypothetical protein
MQPETSVERCTGEIGGGRAWIVDRTLSRASIQRQFQVRGVVWAPSGAPTGGSDRMHQARRRQSHRPNKTQTARRI